MTSEFLRLKDNHPLQLKFNKLMDYADELGISITFETYRTHLSFKDEKGLFFLEDLDSHEPVRELPMALDYKILMHNPKFLQEQKEAEEKRAEAYRLRLEEQKKLAEEQKQKDLEIAAKLKAEYLIKKEKDERELLVKLKEKYESK